MNPLAAAGAGYVTPPRRNSLIKEAIPAEFERAYAAAIHAFKDLVAPAQQEAALDSSTILAFDAHYQAACESIQINVASGDYEGAMTANLLINKIGKVYTRNLADLAAAHGLFTGTVPAANQALVLSQAKVITSLIIDEPRLHGKFVG
jgi:hypothetical protein